MADDSQCQIAEVGKSREVIRVSSKSNLTKLIVSSLRDLNNQTDQSSASISAIEEYISNHYLLQCTDADVVIARQFKLSIKQAIRRGILQRSGDGELYAPEPAPSKRPSPLLLDQLTDSMKLSLPVEHSAPDLTWNSSVLDDPSGSELQETEANHCGSQWIVPELEKSLRSSATVACSSGRSPTPSPEQTDAQRSPICPAEDTLSSSLDKSTGLHAMAETVDSAIPPCTSMELEASNAVPEQADPPAKRGRGRPRNPTSKERRIALPIPLCSFCRGSIESNRDGVNEILLCCVDCGYSGHPTCLKFSDMLVARVKTLRWQCIECKQCYECGKAQIKDDALLFCDGCDRGFHLDCLQPPLTSTPVGEWLCGFCDGTRPDAPKDLLDVVAGESCHIPLELLNNRRPLQLRKSRTQRKSGATDQADEAAHVSSLTQSTRRSRGRPRKLQITADSVTAEVDANVNRSERRRSVDSNSTVRSKPQQSITRVAPKTSRNTSSFSGVRKRKGTEQETEFSANKKRRTVKASKKYKATMIPDYLASTVTENDVSVFRRAQETALQSIAASSKLLMNRPSESPVCSSAVKGKRKRQGRNSSSISPSNNCRYPSTITIGKYLITTWYSAPYPKEFARLGHLYLCEFCLSYFMSVQALSRHTEKCCPFHPPANEIYRSAFAATHAEPTDVPQNATNVGGHESFLSVWEVDGQTQKQYCQNLCLLAKAFLDHKTLYYDVEPFLFYVLTMRESPNEPHQFVGYFSKEKLCANKYNVSCIMVLPPFQRLGFGRFLIDFSYLLSRCERQPGTPERPLSDLGRISYHAYWKSVLLEHLYSRLIDAAECICEATDEDVSGALSHTAACTARMVDDLRMSLNDLVRKTGIRARDLVETMFVLGMLAANDSGDLTMRLNIDVIESYMQATAKKRSERIPIDPSALRWTPYVSKESSDSDEEAEAELVSMEQTTTGNQKPEEIATIVPSTLAATQPTPNRASVSDCQSQTKPSRSSRRLRGLAVADEQCDLDHVLDKPRRRRSANKKEVSCESLAAKNESEVKASTIAVPDLPLIPTAEMFESNDVRVNHGIPSSSKLDSPAEQPPISPAVSLADVAFLTDLEQAAPAVDFVLNEQQPLAPRPPSEFEEHAASLQASPLLQEIALDASNESLSSALNVPFDMAIVTKADSNPLAVMNQPRSRPIDVGQPLSIDVSAQRFTVPNYMLPHQSPQMTVAAQARYVSTYTHSPQTVVSYAPSPHSLPQVGHGANSPHAFAIQQASLSPHTHAVPYRTVSPVRPPTPQTAANVANQYVAPSYIVNTPGWMQISPNASRRHTSQPQTVAQNCPLPLPPSNYASAVESQPYGHSSVNRVSANCSYVQPAHASPSMNSVNPAQVSNSQPMQLPGVLYYSNANSDLISMHGARYGDAQQPARGWESAGTQYHTNQSTSSSAGCFPGRSYYGNERNFASPSVNTDMSVDIDQDFFSGNFGPESATYPYGMNVIGVQNKVAGQTPTPSPYNSNNNNSSYVERPWNAAADTPVSFTSLLMDSGRNGNGGAFAGTHNIGCTSSSAPLASSMSASVLNNSALQNGSANEYEHTQMARSTWSPGAPVDYSPPGASWNAVNWSSTYRQ